MDRPSFEALRDLPGKTIHGDIRLARRAALAPLLVAEGIRIEAGGDTELLMSVHYNPEVGAKTVNVHVPGLGPICRLDVDGPAHRPAGRSHKHALQTPRCPERNIPAAVIDRPDLSGRSIRDVFEVFCSMAKITHNGRFEAPGGEP